MSTIYREIESGGRKNVSQRSALFDEYSFETRAIVLVQENRILVVVEKKAEFKAKLLGSRLGAAVCKLADLRSASAEDKAASN